jgi:hypothetical protein
MEHELCQNCINDIRKLETSVAQKPECSVPRLVQSRDVDFNRSKDLGRPAVGNQVSQ